METFSTMSEVETIDVLNSLNNSKTHDPNFKRKDEQDICGVLNQHGNPCQRVGKCPFHSEKAHKVAPKRGWTREEHSAFLRGLKAYGKGSWKDIAALIPSKTSTQIQSHAQKYFLRQKQTLKNKRSIHDMSLEEFEMFDQNEEKSTPESKRAKTDNESHLDTRQAIVVEPIEPMEPIRMYNPNDVHQSRSKPPVMYNHLDLPLANSTLPSISQVDFSYGHPSMSHLHYMQYYQQLHLKHMQQQQMMLQQQIFAIQASTILPPTMPLPMLLKPKTQVTLPPPIEMRNSPPSSQLPSFRKIAHDSIVLPPLKMCLSESLTA